LWARWSKLYTEAGVVLSIPAISAAVKASTSCRMSTARCAGVSSWMATMKANSTLSRWS
jgi:hypothetical protein